MQTTYGLVKYDGKGESLLFEGKLEGVKVMAELLASGVTLSWYAPPTELLTEEHKEVAEAC